MSKTVTAKTFSTSSSRVAYAGSTSSLKHVCALGSGAHLPASAVGWSVIVNGGFDALLVRQRLDRAPEPREHLARARVAERGARRRAHARAPAPARDVERRHAAQQQLERLRVDLRRAQRARRRDLVEARDEGRS